MTGITQIMSWFLKGFCDTFQKRRFAMKNKIKVVFKNKPDNQILDKDFFSLLFNHIVDLKKKKEVKNELKKCKDL